MFKKLVIATAIIAASSSVAIASPCCANTGAPYVGVSLSNNTVGAGNSYYRGITGNISLGYGAIVSPCVYLAGEIFGIPGSGSETNNTGQGSVSARTTWGYGASIIPGWYLNDKSMIYGRLGGTVSHFNGPNSNKGGWHVGVGGQTTIMPCWDLRGEYTYTEYSRISALGRPQSDMFSLGLVYKIA